MAEETGKGGTEKVIEIPIISEILDTKMFTVAVVGGIFIGGICILLWAMNTEHGKQTVAKIAEGSVNVPHYQEDARSDDDTGDDEDTEESEQGSIPRAFSSM